MPAVTTKIAQKKRPPRPKIGPYATCKWDCEKRCWVIKMTERGRKIAEQFINDYCGGRPVKIYAHKYRRQYQLCRNNGYTADEVNQACMSGVVQAVIRFRPDYGWQLSTYAGYAMRSRVQHELFGRRCRAANAYYQLWNNSMMSGTERDSEPGHTDVYSLALMDHAEKNSTGDNPIETAELTSTIRHYVAKLPDHYRDVINRRFFQGQTLKFVAERTGITKEAVRLRESRAIQALKRMMVPLEDRKS